MVDFETEGAVACSVAVTGISSATKTVVGGSSGGSVGTGLSAATKESTGGATCGSGGTVASAATKATTGSGACGSGGSVLSAATKETEGASSGAGGAWAHGEDAGVFYMNEGLPAGGETPGDDWPEGEVERSGWVGE